MFETIVWATDGSELADSALPLVTELARACGSKIVAVHANEVFRGGRYAGGPLLADEDEIQIKIAAQVDDLRDAGFATANLKIETSDRHGTAQLIAEAAAQFRADLIVLGTHGNGTIATGALGGVITRGLLNVAPCPVLAVPALHDRAAHAEPRQAVPA